ncbi:hypothetical protein HDU98_010453 [Podochytrium sp. JEL0797]|nr:hypothetical protein HDU98_010453 [Podochytrium sp. JEL0797]
MTFETILITGATGKIGQHLVKELLSRSSNCVVRVYVRDTAKAQALFATVNGGGRVEYHKGDNNDLAALGKGENITFYQF